MPLYPFECRDCGPVSYEESFGTWSDHPSSLPCGCGGTKRRVYTVPEMSVDHVYEHGFNRAMGYHPRSRHDRDEWFKTNDFRPMESCEFEKHRRRLEDMREQAIEADPSRRHAIEKARAHERAIQRGEAKVEGR